jgi:predicted O-methyltransferase YrrM
MRILDCFPYFNEEELLELRINLLTDYVDKFIITDADHTHSGTPKPFTCKNTLNRLGLMSDKIQVIEVNLPSYDKEPDAWYRERRQRDVAAEFIGCDDIAIVSDCDEIINPEFIRYYCNVAKSHPNSILRIPMVLLNARADLRVFKSDETPIVWDVPFICNKKHLSKYTLSQIRETRAVKTNDIDYSDIFIAQDDKIEEAGWHFSWMGNYERMKIKADSYLHSNDTWFGGQLGLSEDYVATNGGKDPLGRDEFILKEISYDVLPPKIFELHRVQKYLLPKMKIDHIYQNSEFGENWFTYPNLYSSIVREFPSGSKFIEVGSWKGKSSSYMAVEIANSGKNIEFMCVDTWEGSVEHQGYEDLKNLYDIFKSNMKPVEDYYTAIRAKSLDAVNLFADNSLDFVFIDASHEYEDVKNDILAWYPKVRNGGILAGHDYFDNGCVFPGVYKAVNEVFTDFEVSEQCFIVRKV